MVVLFGVPQGSVLGLLLLLIFTNDLDHEVPRAAYAFKFADYTKVEQPISFEQNRESSSGIGQISRLGRHVGDGIHCGQIQSHAHCP